MLQCAPNFRRKDTKPNLGHLASSSASFRLDPDQDYLAFGNSVISRRPAIVQIGPNTQLVVKIKFFVQIVQCKL